MEITLWRKLEKASLEQKRGTKVSYSIVLLKSSNETSIKSNVTWIKTMRCTSHFLLFHRRQNGRAYIKIRRKNLKAYTGNGRGGGVVCPCQSFKTNGMWFFWPFTHPHTFLSFELDIYLHQQLHVFWFISWCVGDLPSWFLKSKRKVNLHTFYKFQDALKQDKVLYISRTWIKEVEPKAWSLKVIGQTKDYAVQVSIRRSLRALPI